MTKPTTITPGAATCRLICSGISVGAVQYAAVVVEPSLQKHQGPGGQKGGRERRGGRERCSEQKESSPFVSRSFSFLGGGGAPYPQPHPQPQATASHHNHNYTSQPHAASRRKPLATQRTSVRVENVFLLIFGTAVAFVIACMGSRHCTRSAGLRNAVTSAQSAHVSLNGIREACDRERERERERASGGSLISAVTAPPGTMRRSNKSRSVHESNDTR